MERIVMNTESLQKHFPDVYKDFFARNDLVLSGCFSFPWTYEGIGLNSVWYLRIKSSIPLKCYVWIKKRNDKKIIFNNVTFFNLNKKEFEKVEYSKINKEEQKVVNLLLEEFHKNNINFWVEIEILSETARWHSLWFSPTSSAILSYWLLFLMSESNWSDFINIEKDVFSLSWKINFLSRSWYNTSLWHNSVFTLKWNKSVSYFLSSAKDVDIDSFDDISYTFSSLNNSWVWLPFDYYILFSWLPSNTNQVEYYKDLQRKNDYISDFVKIINKDTKEKYFLDFEDKNQVLQTKLKHINLENLKMLEYLYKIYNEPFNEEFTSKFINHVNTCRNVIETFEEQNSFAWDFSHLFKNNRTNYQEIMWICPIYTWKLWWGYILVTKSWVSRNTVLKTIEDIKNNYPQIELEYASYMDDSEVSPIKIEQFITNWIYSKYVDKNKVIFKDNKWNSFLWDYNEIIKNHSDWLLFDMIESKIYFNGQKLTSKDIPSQNTTIEVINKLLENIWEEISNKDLPISSYTWNKNEMLWKIILPLLKFVEAKTGEKLQIVCKWSITDFFIKMWELNLKIWTIRKI